MEGGKKKPRPDPRARAGVGEGLREDLLRSRRVIRAAIRLLYGPQRWTRGALARDSRGRDLLPDDEKAVRFCINGALLRAGARIDKRPLELKPGAKDGDIGAEDVSGSPSAMAAINLVGYVEARMLEAAGEGSWDGLRFSTRRRRGQPSRRLSRARLLETLNDSPAFRQRTALAILNKTERALTRNLRMLPRTTPEAADG